MESVEQNKQVVRDYLDAAANDDFDRLSEIVSEPCALHEPEGTNALSRAQYRAAAAELRKAGPTTIYQCDLFGEADLVFAIVHASVGGTEFSSVDAFRIEDGLVAERFRSALAPVAWRGTSTDGRCDSDVTRNVLHRWYEEMYGGRRFLELAPALCGPQFTRHEATGDFAVSAQEHATRLAAALSNAPTQQEQGLQYRVAAEGDKVGVIGCLQEAAAFEGSASHVQAWRVENGKFVESWWAGFALNVDW